MSLKEICCFSGPTYPTWRKKSGGQYRSQGIVRELSKEIRSILPEVSGEFVKRMYELAQKETDNMARGNVCKEKKAGEG